MDREDFVQVGMIAMLGALQSFRSDRMCSLETYAGIRVRGAILDEVRSRSFIPRYQLKKNHGPAKFVDAAELNEIVDDFSENVILDELTLNDLVSRLPDQERMVVMLRDYAGFTLIEIAESMHLSEGRVSQIRSSALKRLREGLRHEI